MVAEDPMYRLSDLPLEMLNEVVQYLPPEALQSLRATSTGMRELVDDYVRRLVDREQLVDSSGVPIDRSMGEAEALAAWRRGEYGNAAFPAVAPPVDTDEVMQKYDTTFGVYNNPEYQRGMLINVYDRIIDEGGQRGLEVREELEVYTRELLRRGRFTNRLGDPIPANTNVDTALDMWRNGEIIWRPPQ